MIHCHAADLSYNVVKHYLKWDFSACHSAESWTASGLPHSCTLGTGGRAAGTWALQWWQCVGGAPSCHGHHIEMIVQLVIERRGGESALLENDQ